MQIITTEAMRQLDREAIEFGGIPGVVLMDRAGKGLARIVAERSGPPVLSRVVCLMAGKGNNGGDAFVAARYLKDWGYRVSVWLAGACSALTGDALTHCRTMEAAGIALVALETEAEWDALALHDRCLTVVDGVLGTGITGAARGVAAAAIRAINRLGKSCQVVAIDVPSGLDSDSGTAGSVAVLADITVTMAYPKVGLVAPSAQNMVGTLRVVDIGIPASLLETGCAELNFLSDIDVTSLLVRRARMAHKGTYGHVLVVAGALGYGGAAALAATGALRSGAGLVSVATAQPVASSVATLVPEAMVHGLPATPHGAMQATALAEWRADLSPFDAILVGPGLTLSEDTAELMRWLLSETSCPLVIDADALTLLAQAEGGMGSCGERPVVLTPHPGEMARLLDCDTAAVQMDRVAAVVRSQDVTGATVVLKGAGTLITGPSGRVWINMTGNPGMATGGTGDVLAGMVAGWLAQGLSAEDAACVAVHLHGCAGDAAVVDGAELSLVASDLLDALPSVIKRLTGR